MKPSNDLFRLIKTLTRSEKGYFKKFAQLHGSGKNSDYLRLFDEIDKQTDEYDEDLVLKKFKNKPILKHLSATKTYLFQLIIRSLRAYYEQTIWSFKNESVSQGIEVLIEKGLYDIADKLIEKQEEVNLKHDDKLALIKLYKIQRSYISTFQIGKLNVFDNLHKTIELIDTYRLSLNYSELYLQIFSFLNTQNNVRTEEQKKEWEQFIQNPLLQSLPENASFHTRLYFYLTHFAYHAIMQQFDEQGNNIRTVVALWDEHQHLKSEQLILFLSTLNNYFIYCYSHNFLEEFEQYLNNQTIAGNSTSVQAVWFSHTSNWNMAIHIKHHQVEKCVKLAENIHDQIRLQYSGIIKPSSEIALLGNCALIFICSFQFQKALDILEYLLNNKHKNIRKDLMVYFRLWYLIIHLELENDILLEHALRSVQRYAINQEYYFEYENLFIRFMRKYLNTPYSQRKELYSQLLEAIEELEDNNEIERNYIQREGLHKLWVKHKISGQNLLEIIQKQTEL
ncbi:MAG: hypothetical protein IPM47_07730 [Sphingobacteriales bacterium]|nr:MAG: hypothetical protein IPM47_07730 [Sphingobacteriales bacterium]